MILPKFLWDYGHSTIQIWRRYNKLEGKGFTSGWCASLKNASKPRTNLVPRVLSYSPPERKRNLGTKLYKHAITIDRFHMTSRRYLRTKQWIGGHACAQKNPVGIERFSHVKTFLSFQANCKAADHATWLKTMYWPATFQTSHFIGPYNLHYLLLSGIGALLCHHPYCFPSQSQIWFGIDAGPPHYQPVEKACSKERVCIV